MKRSAFSTHAWRLSVLSLGFGALFSLAGCDTLNDWLAPDTVNYKGAATAPSLTVPSDLTKADISQRFTAPPAINALGGAAPRALTPPATPRSACLRRRIRSACMWSAMAIAAGWWSTAARPTSSGRNCRSSGPRTASRSRPIRPRPAS